MKRNNNSMPPSGFSIPELLSVLAVIGILSAMGYGVFAKISSNAKEQKLRSEVATLNSAVSAYQGFGGNLDSATSAENVISRLRSVANSDIASRIPGLSSSMVDRRIAGVMQTQSEADTDEPRVIWDAGKKSFQIAKSGEAGISAFYLDDADAEMTPDVDMREFAFLYAGADGWVWDFGPDNATASPIGPTEISTYDPITIVNNLPPSGIDPEDYETDPPAQLNAPVFSLGGGSFSIRDYPLALNIINPNSEGSSRIYYQTDHGPWTRYEPDTAIAVTPDSTVVAQTIALNRHFLDSSGTSHFYEATPVQLNAPAITASSPSFGVFNNRMVLVSLENTNGEDPAEMQYSINDGPWLDYHGIFIVDKTDFPEGAMVKSLATSDDQYFLDSEIDSKWISPTSLDVDESDGAFHDPSGGPNMETNLTLENPYNNYFEWGAVTNQWGEINSDLSKSWMDFASVDLDNIVVGERFKLGDIDYYDGVFKAGTTANFVRFAVGLGFDSAGTIYNTEFDYLFNVAHTTNGQNSFGNARLIMPPSFSSYEVDGIAFDLLLEFGLADGVINVQSETTTSTALYGTLFEREEDAAPRENRNIFTGIFSDFWNTITNWGD